ncbi:hypothetical protein DFJ64_1606 [Thermasporomyces composti]|uniref:FtsX-like permease family protein n=1 Tax=Thermasporomyces composti TaxID=696763 RepID=A0A3D9V4B0_THECX|nr:hypothetical protein DFJ64_1606 [Thermasporomyces composti]
MITLVFAQLAARWGQALTAFVLSVAATVAAVSVPAFAVAIDRAAIANELAAAEHSDVTVSLPPLLVSSPEPRTRLFEASEDLPAYADARSRLTGFTNVTTAQIHVQGIDGQPLSPQAHSMLARDGFCRHVRFRQGRCPVGSREIAVPASLAASLELTAGREVVLTPVRRAEDRWEPQGPPATFTIAGLFTARDPAAPYWSLQDPLGRLGDKAILTNRTALSTLPHAQELVYLDAILPPRLLTPERIPRVRQQLDAVERRLEQEDPYLSSPSTTLPRLLDRIEAHGRHARALLPIAVAPLLVLCWFVIHLAVSHGGWSRQQEIGTVALRGATWWIRALAVSAESLLPLLAGVPVGLVLARVLIAATAAGPPGLVAIDSQQLLAAAFAAAGSVVAALLALRRQLTAPVSQLLRQMPSRSRRITVAAVELLVIAMGLVVLAELRVLDGELVGVMVAAPVLVILAVGTLASLLVRPLIDFVGRGSLRRGRIGAAVAALYLARRPGSVRLLVVLALVFGTLGFAAAATDVAAEGRLAEAQRLLGAPRVLEIQRAGRQELLRAVRAADPDGRYAMAVMSSPNVDGAPVLAVDSTRLATVALWSPRYGALSSAQVADRLRPPAPEPIVIRDGELVAELAPDPFTGDDELTVSLLARTPEDEQLVVSFGRLAAEAGSYRAEVTGCGDGCRLTGVALSTSETGQTGVEIRALRQNGVDLLPPEVLADARRWLVPNDGPITDQLRFVGAEDGLLITHPNARPEATYELRTVDAPFPLPAVTAGGVPGEHVTNVDGEPVRFTRRARMAGLPGVGASGALVDLEYAERLTAEPGTATRPRVWLSADAPERVVDALREQGLVIVEDRRIESLRASIDRTGAALALRAYDFTVWMTVVVGLAALALVVVVDRRTWGPSMRALRAQGVPDRVTTGAALWSYAGIVVTSAVIGAAAAAVAWFAAGGRLPLGVDATLLAAWPRWWPVLASYGAVVALVVVAAAVGGWWQGRQARTGPVRRHPVARQREVRS